MTSAAERKRRIAHFWGNVERPLEPGDPNDPQHWYWKGSHRTDNGKALAWFNGKLRYAATVAYELTYGPGLTPVRHRPDCREPGCINPDHHYRQERVPRFASIPEVAEALRVAFADNPPLCSVGHQLRPGVSRGNCGECNRERREAYKEELHKPITW